MIKVLAVLSPVVLMGLILVALDPYGWRDTAWVDGETHGRWQVVFTGHGEVAGDDSSVSMEPQSAVSADITHGALVTTHESYLDADFSIDVLTESQVRAGDPNPWETGWVVWNYRDNDHFYALALKPNGWEISKQDPDYVGKQRFIVSGTDDVFPIGTTYHVEVGQDWPEMTVSVDGQVLATVVDEETPYRGGAVGMYTEDARVKFTDLVVVGDGTD